MHPHAAVSRARRALLTGVCTLVALLAGVPANAQPVDGAALPGLIVVEDDLPLDELGRPDLDAVRGPRAAAPPDEGADPRRRELLEQRAVIGVLSSGGARPAAPVTMPREAVPPPRRDSGDADPDRLRTVPSLPVHP